MGAGYSGHFNGTKGGKSTIERNVKGMSKKYPMTQHGYFGQPGKNSGVRVIYSKNPIATAKDFYSRISRGGKEVALSNGHGKQTILPDGSRIVYRTYSKSGSPAVEIRIINPGSVHSQKVHFEEKRK